MQSSLMALTRSVGDDLERVVLVRFLFTVSWQTGQAEQSFREAAMSLAPVAGTDQRQGQSRSRVVPSMRHAKADSTPTQGDKSHLILALDARPRNLTA